MVKRGISGKGRGGAPPLPRQKAALRIVQLTLAMLATFLFNLAYTTYRSAPDPNLGEAVVLTACACVALGGALWMGIRTIRGPQPPSLD